MTEPIFADRNKSLKDYLIEDRTKENYNKMYGILQEGLLRMQRNYNNASTKQEASELEQVIKSFNNGIYLLEKAYVFISSQRSTT